MYFIHTNCLRHRLFIEVQLTRCDKVKVEHLTKLKMVSGGTFYSVCQSVCLPIFGIGDLEMASRWSDWVDCPSIFPLNLSVCASLVWGMERWLVVGVDGWIGIPSFHQPFGLSVYL